MDFFLHVIIRACLVLLPVLGYNVVFGRGKIFHFGHEGMTLVVSYVLWVLFMQYHLPYGFALLGSFVAMVVLVFLFAWLSLRLEEDGFGVMSIAVHLAFLAVILNWQTVTRGALGIPRIPRSPLPASIEGFAILILLVSLIWIAIIWWLDHGRFGRALGALSSHPWHARSLGINRRKMHVLAFFIAGFGGLLSAIFFPPYIFLLSPTDYQFGAMIFAITIVIAGRPGSVLGVTLATFLITFLHEGLRFAPLAPSILGPVRMLIFGLILFAVVWWRRDTLFPQAREI